MISFYLTLIDDPKDESKFESIYNLYRKRMWYVANEIINDHYEAEDAVHNAFIGIAKNIHHIGEVESKATFAYVITAAKHAALNIVERKKDKSVLQIDDYKNIPDETDINTACSIENKELIISALKKMPDFYRDLLYLHYFEDMSEKEIATQSNTNYATIRKQISRAKKMFVDLMKKEDK